MPWSETEPRFTSPSVAMYSCDFSARGPRLDSDPQENAVGGLLDDLQVRRPIANSLQPIASYNIPRTNPRTTYKTSQATIGLKSIIPIGGRIFRIGSMSQLVSAYTGRIHRL